MFKSIKKVSVFGKTIDSQFRGGGKIPLFVVGPASLYLKDNLLPSEFNEMFTIYFADIFQAVKQDKEISYSDLKLDDFVKAISLIQDQLNIKKFGLIGHSTNGILAIEYAHMYPEKVDFMILVGTAPIRGGELASEEKNYFACTQQGHSNVTELRRNAYNKGKASLSTASSLSFKERYQARSDAFFAAPVNTDSLWEDISLDMDLVNAYFSSIQSYDLRTRFTNGSCKIPTFVALGMLDASAPCYMWPDLIEKANIFKKLKIYIFASDHYLLSKSISSDGKPKEFAEETQKFLKDINLTVGNTNDNNNNNMVKLN